jgi:hypothetical protein
MPLRSILFLTLVSAVCGGFTSHKYDCFNIGPCTGNVDYWITLDKLATYSFIGFWLVLVIVVVAQSRKTSEVRLKFMNWLVAIGIPPAALLAANWFFNLGVKVPAI